MYKKLLLMVLSAITIQSVKAQTEKGSQMLGASFGVNTTSSDQKVFDYNTNALGPNIHGKQTQINFAPTYSYFIANNLDLGVSAGYSHQKQDFDSPSISPQRSKTNSFTAGVYLRKYVLYDNKIGLRVGPQFNYELAKTNQGNDAAPMYDTKYTSKYYRGGVGVDLVFFPVKRIGLTAALGGAYYTRQDVEGSYPATYNSFNLNFLNSFMFSVNYVFGH